MLPTIHPSELPKCMIKKSLWISLRDSLDSKQAQDFAVFKLKNSESFIPTVVCTIVSIFATLKSVLVTVAGEPLLFKLANYSFGIIPLVGWTYVYVLRKYVHTGVLSEEGKRVIQIGNAAIIIRAIITTGVLLCWVGLILSIRSGKVLFYHIYFDSLLIISSAM